MELMLIIIGAFFAVLGGLALLNEVAERFNKPKVWTDYDHKKRFFIILISSFLLSIARGGIFAVLNERKKEALDILSELETRLTQMDGLIQATITSVQRDVPLNILNKLAEKIAVYGIRAGQGPKLKYNWYGPLKYQEGETLRQTLYGIRQRLSAWKELGDKKFVETELMSLLESVERAKSLTRQLINEYR